ncbi:hypothetical protein [Christiangramia sediminis]|uniref:Uncharacterized protein n=1 Tax=Christiangramia sediminis TaxID=2881336 RepID=A0A9X1RT62_9FLAO|nr:hypothetical protein [Christiangramia sediminis]MCB7479838.1 hypothetical protein [Christiangramia sediminis]
MLKKLLIVFILFSTSCQSQNQEIELNLRNCVTQGLKDLRPVSADFYDLMSSLEDKMIKKGILESRSKKDYLELLNSIAADSKATKKFYEKNIKNLYQKFPLDLFLANDLIFNQCPYKIYLQNKKENIKIYNIGKLQFQSMENGFRNLELNQKLIINFQESDFEKIVYRAPIIQIILINMNYKYNQELKQQLKELEEYKKNRTFLNKN